MLKLTVLNWLFHFGERQITYDIRKIHKRDYVHTKKTGEQLVFNLVTAVPRPSDFPANFPSVRGYVRDAFGRYTILLPLSNNGILSRLADAKRPYNGFIMKYEHSPYHFVLVCSPKDIRAKFDVNSEFIEIRSAKACGVRFQVLRFIDKQRYLVSVFTLVLGLLFTFAGGARWRVLIHILGFFAGTGALLFALFVCAQPKTELSHHIATVLLSVAGGGLASYLSVKFIRFLHFVFGAIAGGAVAYVASAPPRQMETAMRFGVIAAAAICMGIVIAHSAHVCIVLLTSFFGAYLIAESSGVVFGLTNEYFNTFATLRNNYSVVWPLYCGVAATFALGIIGFFLQKRNIDSRR